VTIIGSTLTYDFELEVGAETLYCHIESSPVDLSPFYPSAEQVLDRLRSQPLDNENVDTPRRAVDTATSYLAGFLELSEGQFNELINDLAVNFRVPAYGSPPVRFASLNTHLLINGAADVLVAADGHVVLAGLLSTTAFLARIAVKLFDTESFTTFRSQLVGGFLHHAAPTVAMNEEIQRVKGMSTSIIRLHSKGDRALAVAKLETLDEDDRKVVYAVFEDMGARGQEVPRELLQARQPALLACHPAGPVPGSAETHASA